MKEFVVLMVGSQFLHVIVKGSMAVITNEGVLEIESTDSPNPVARFPNGHWSAVVERNSLVLNQQESV